MSTALPDSLPEYLNGLYSRVFASLYISLSLLVYQTPIRMDHQALLCIPKFKPQPQTFSPSSQTSLPKNDMGNFHLCSSVPTFSTSGSSPCHAKTPDKADLRSEAVVSLSARDSAHHGGKAWQQIPLHPESGSSEQGMLKLSLLSPFYSVLNLGLWKGTTVRVCFPISLNTS